MQNLLLEEKKNYYTKQNNNSLKKIILRICLEDNKKKMSFYNFLPSEIVYHKIIPLIPCYGLSKQMLKLQKKRIKLVGYIQNILSIDDVSMIKKHILKLYDGQLDYCYEDPNSYLYVNLQDRYDYIYIIN